MTTQSITSITDGQKKQYKRFVEDAGERALAEVGLDKDGLQKLIERGDEFQARIITGIRELSVSNQFEGEEVESSYGYPKEYACPKPIADQIKAVAEIFGLDPSNALEFVKNLPELPDGAEGWFAIPRWEKIAPTYGEAVQKALDLIKQTRNGKFYNYRDGKLGSQYLRQHEHTTAMFKRLGDQQEGHDILVVPAQFGLKHRGRSVRRAREVFNASEFGLGSFQIAAMILTHPERLQRYNDLWIDCAGDEYDLSAGRGFSYASSFLFSGGGVRFGASWFGSPSARYGSVSGFVPQS